MELHTYLFKCELPEHNENAIIEPYISSECMKIDTNMYI